ncbi:MAG TPA: hypothetical protein VF339_19830 [Gammaproteobacteria bacterium]
MTTISAPVAARLVLAAAVSCLAMGQANAQYRGGPGAGVRAASSGESVALWVAHTESSNVLRATDSMRDYYDSLGVLFDLTRNRERVQASLLGDLEYRMYGDDSASNEQVGSLGASLSTVLLPQRFTWSFRDNYLDGRTNPLGPETPDNRERINVFETGPQLDVPLGGRTSFSAGGTWRARRYEESQLLDSDSVTYSVGIHRQVRPLTSVSLMADTTEAEYQTTDEKYDIDGVRLVYQRALARGSAVASAGVNRLTIGLLEVDRPLFNVMWSRSLTGRMSLVLQADRQYTDAGTLLAESLDQPTAAPIDVTLSADPNDRREASADWSLSLDRTDISVQFTLFADDFEREDSLDSDGGRIGVDMLRRLTRVSAAGVSVHREQRQFSNELDDNTDTVVRLRYSRGIGRVLDVEFDAQLTKRDGVGSFDERTLRITLVYVPARR